MSNSMKKIFLGTLLTFVCVALVSNMYAYRKQGYMAGYGKTSKINGLPKCKTTSGHSKRTSKDYTFVNAYARSR